MEFIPAIAMIALILKLVDFLKSITNKDKNAIVTQGFTWLFATAVVALYSQTAWAGNLEFGGQTLENMNLASIIAVGLALGSTASTGFDLKKAIDRSDSAKTPTLLPPEPVA